jgi:APA family basic amino acid/polyamine antiporter
VGQAILEEARRRGVEAIVLGAEEPSRIRGGSRLGGRGGPLENFVGDVTKYVVRKAACRVIVTAPSERDFAEFLTGGKAGQDSPVRDSSAQGAPAQDAPVEIAPAAPLVGPGGGPGGAPIV